MAKITWQLNFKSKSVDKQPSDKDEHKTDAFIPEFQNGSHYTPHPHPRRYRSYHPLPNNNNLPPRTTRADFITPDQRAIFGPAIEPFEMTDRVKPDGL